MNEPELFKSFKAAYLPDLKVAVDSYSPFDAICHTAKVVVEFKCRRSHYDEVLIEWPKYSALLNRAADRGYRPIYVCSTPLGVWAWDLTHIDLSWFKKELPRQTDFENKEIVTKTISYLSLDEGSYLHKIKL
jgi:hypothetical protein